MDENKKYRVVIRTYFEDGTFITHTSVEFVGKEEHEQLATILRNLGDLKSVNFLLPSGRKVFLTAAMIDRSIFHLEEVACPTT